MSHFAGAEMRRSGEFSLITGGAGFIGTNLADQLARKGRKVLIYDNLSRPGVEANLAWLCERHGNRIEAEIATLADRPKIERAVQSAAEVYHLGAQVAVTTSLEAPQADFEINARGTLNVLEAIRSCSRPPGLIFTSTNKVYGKLGDLALLENERRYQPVSERLRSRGIGEEQPLDFYSPYGCSKGAADQYVVDYARIYNLPTVVFRMSCIYGPHQHGTEDQGWVAHFLLQALHNRAITIFGDGKQVRDILHVDDLVRAMLLAQANMERIAGRWFNIGGGPANTVSLLELLELIRKLHGALPSLSWAQRRPGDQPYYVSDTGAFKAATGWASEIGSRTGVARLYEWLRAHRCAILEPAGATGAAAI